MLSGPPLPLPHDIPLHQLLAHARHPGILGAWVRGSVRALHLYEVSGAAHRLLTGPDLGYLLSRCSRIALREGVRPVVLDAEAVIRWRALEVVTASPYLVGLDRLSALFPGLEPSSTGLLVPLASCSPEQVMSELLACRVQVIGGSIAYPRLKPLI